MYNTVSGVVIIQLMEGSVMLSFGEVLTLDLASDSVVDTGDFNSDGKADLLTLNTVTGALEVVLLDGLIVNSIEPVFTVDVANDWSVVNAGDYNGDGDLDVLLFNTGTGETEALLLDGTTLQSVQPITQLNVAAGWMLHSGKP